MCQAVGDTLVDSTETPVSASLAQDAEEDDCGQALPEVSMDDVQESPGIHADMHGKDDRNDAQLELDIEHAQRNSEVVPEVEPESDSMPGASQCPYLLCVLERVLTAIPCRPFRVRVRGDDGRPSRSERGFSFDIASGGGRGRERQRSGFPGGLYGRCPRLSQACGGGRSWLLEQ